MSWLRIDDEFDAHPKVVQLGTHARRWTWLRVLVYTTKYQSPVVVDNLGDMIPGVTPAFLRDCETLGLLDRNNDGILSVHDWQEYQAGDPAKALRQAKWRAKRNGHVDEAVDALVDGDVDASLARARGPYPYPSSVSTDAAATNSADDPIPPGLADAASYVIAELQELGVTGEEVYNTARRNGALARAWIDKARHEAKANPAGYIAAGLRSKQWPSEASGPKAPTMTPVELAEAFIRTVGAGYERRTMDEELTARGIVGAAHARLLALHAGLEPLEAA